MPTDGGRVKQKLRPLHGGETRGLGVPLIPANQHADFAEAGVPRAEPKVARCEIEFLVIQRVVRDVHFSINAKQRSVGIDDCCGIVIHAGAAFFEKGNNDHDSTALGQALECFRRGSGNRFSQVEVVVVFTLAEILSRKEFLRADDIRSICGRLFDLGKGSLEVGGWVAVCLGLNQRKRNRFAFRGHVTARARE